MSEWISVEERLPAVGHTVLFATKNAVLPGYYTDAGHWYLIFQSPSKSDDGIPGVTHWQPLPPPPSTTDAAPLRKALERARMLLDRGASREQAIGVIADALATNELPDAAPGEAERELVCDELIMRAADEERQLKLTCHLCGGVGEWNIDRGFYGHKHEPGCLHLRARALREESE